jgi:hypothetical protein
MQGCDPGAATGAERGFWDLTGTWCELVVYMRTQLTQVLHLLVN